MSDAKKAEKLYDLMRDTFYKELMGAKNYTWVESFSALNFLYSEHLLRAEKEFEQDLTNDAIDALLEMHESNRDFNFGKKSQESSEFKQTMRKFLPDEEPEITSILPNAVNKTSN